MIANQVQNTNGVFSTSQREADFARLEQDSQYSDLLQCDEDELTEIRRATARNLDDVFKRYRLDRHSKRDALAYIDALSMAEALQSVAAARLGRGNLDGAARSAITSLQWHENARKLRETTGLHVDVPPPDAANLWLMLVDIYERLGETSLLSRTVAKLSAPSAPGSVTRALRLTVERARGMSVNGPPGYMAVVQRSGGVRSPRIAVWILALVMLGTLAFVIFQAQGTTKGMIDHSSVGTEYLQIAMRRDTIAGSEDSLVLAAQEFASLQARLDGWSWPIAIGSAIPPIGTQFNAMKAMAELGPRVVAATLGESARRLAAEASPTAICQSSDRLRSVKGNLLDQLEENRQTLLELSSRVTNGLC